MGLVKILPGFWHSRLEVNASQAIFHQWQQLEASGCIQNFRIAAGQAAGWREGWFFADSDAYKWLDAAACILANHPDPQLAAVVDGFIALLGQAQMPDGYLFTYNQIHFPGQRWQNLQIEHELYCHGHLIEAGVSHFEATSRQDLLQIACRAADRIVVDFAGQGAARTPGHEEIEIALLRLFSVTQSKAYLDLARQFIEQRGRQWGFGLSIVRQNMQVARREKTVRQRKAAYLAAHPDFQPYRLPAGNFSKKPRFTTLRWYASALGGGYFQQHQPIRRQAVPVGHSVRFAYLQTAAARLCRETADRSLLPALEQSWERMVTRRLYVTGGIGSLPGIEGFGRDYELDPEIAYAETCAALGSLFWNWEMAQLSGECKYSDLFEWQLYNAAAPGMGLDGSTYLYNNPLACRGGVTRKAWYAVPCCPSNLSRAWASLWKYIYAATATLGSAGRGELRIHQYISSQLTEGPLQLQMDAHLPWQGRVRLKVMEAPAEEWQLHLRRPSWAAEMKLTLNAEPVLTTPEAHTSPGPGQERTYQATASGYDPRLAEWIRLRRVWQAGDEIEIDFRLPIELRRAHPRVRGHAGKATLTRGPLVYCLESVDNPGLNLFTCRLDPASLTVKEDETLPGGIVTLHGRTVAGEPLVFIPYLLWGNRGESQMTVWVNVG